MYTEHLPAQHPMRLCNTSRDVQVRGLRKKIYGATLSILLKNIFKFHIYKFKTLNWQIVPREQEASSDD